MDRDSILDRAHGDEVVDLTSGGTSPTRTHAEGSSSGMLAHASASLVSGHFANQTQGQNMIVGSMNSNENEIMRRVLEASRKAAEQERKRQEEAAQRENEALQRVLAASLEDDTANASDQNEECSQAVKNSLLTCAIEDRRRRMKNLYYDITSMNMPETKSSEQEGDCEELNQAQKYLHRIRECLPAAAGSTKVLPKEIASEMIALIFEANGGRTKYENDRIGIDNDGTARTSSQQSSSSINSISSNGSSGNNCETSTSSKAGEAPGVHSKSNGASARQPKSRNRTQKKAQYGSIYPDLAHAIFERGQLKNGELFVDIGSGIGQAVLHAPLYAPGAYSVGLELISIRHTHAIFLETKMNQVREYVKLYHKNKHEETRGEDADSEQQLNPAQKTEIGTTHTMMLCGSFAESKVVPFNHPEFLLVQPTYAKDRSNLIQMLKPGADLNGGVTPEELFAAGDLFFLNNAEGTMRGRNTENLMEHIARLMRGMKVGARMITVDQVSELKTNCWNKLENSGCRKGEDHTCWMKEQPVVLHGAYSWNRGDPRDHILYLYEKMRNTWICNSCTCEHSMEVESCDVCRLDPNQRPAEMRRSKRRRVHIEASE